MPESERVAATAEVSEAVAAFVDEVIADAADARVRRILGAHQVGSGYVVELETVEPGDGSRDDLRRCRVEVDGRGRIVAVDRG